MNKNVSFAKVGDFFQQENNENQHINNQEQSIFSPYLLEYYKMAKNLYGDLPEHCFQTNISFGEVVNGLASTAICSENKVIINKQDPDFFWTFCHEMEHIRTAQSINKDNSTGLTSNERIEGTNFFAGTAMNEALTEISVETMLNRKQDKIGYFESIQLVRQLGAALGKGDKELLRYYHKEGQKDLQEEISLLTGDKELFENLRNTLDNLQLYHIEDIFYERKKNNGYICKPLGKFPSTETRYFRKQYENYVYSILDKLRDNNQISAKEYNERKIAMNKLSPYNPIYRKLYNSDIVKQ